MQGNAAGRRRVVPIVVAVCLLGTPTAVPADSSGIYRWTDEQGTVHFSDRRPSGGTSSRTITRDLEHLNVIQGLTPSEKRRIQRRRDRRIDQRQRRLRTRRRDAAHARAAERLREKRCEQARETVQHLDKLLRAGHTLHQDIRYNRKRRRMVKRRRLYCR